MFDINGGEALIITVLALVLIGPERLPQYAAQLARLVRRAKAFVVDARERVVDELGPDVADVDWSKLDPRQYDPRRIVRDALFEDGPLLPGLGDMSRARKPQPAAVKSVAVAGADSGSAMAQDAAVRGSQATGAQCPPFDADAT